MVLLADLRVAIATYGLAELVAYQALGRAANTAQRHGDNGDLLSVVAIVAMSLYVSIKLFRDFLENRSCFVQDSLPLTSVDTSFLVTKQMRSFNRKLPMTCKD